MRLSSPDELVHARPRATATLVAAWLRRFDSPVEKDERSEHSRSVDVSASRRSFALTHT